MAVIRLEFNELPQEQFKIILLDELSAEKFYSGRVSYVRKACMSAGFEPRITDHGDGPSALLNAVSTGRCVSLLPALLQEMNHAGVVFRPLQQKNLKVKSYAVSRLDEQRGVMEAFVNAITRASKEMSAKYDVHASSADIESEE